MSTPFNKLVALFDEEGQLLRKGDLVSLEKIAREKERLWHQCQSTPNLATLPDLEAIRKKARLNARFLLSAREGLVAARQKLAQAAVRPEGLRTYGADGQKKRLTHETGASDSKR